MIKNGSCNTSKNYFFWDGITKNIVVKGSGMAHICRIGWIIYGKWKLEASGSKSSYVGFYSL